MSQSKENFWTERQKDGRTEAEKDGRTEAEKDGRTDPNSWDPCDHSQESNKTP